MKREWRVLPDDEAATFVHVRNPTCEVRGCLPVVVIDPEDREQVERLTRRFWLERQGTPETAWCPPFEVDTMQAALREFANPSSPRPDEPTDPAARVKDKDGDNWARIERVDGAFWVNALGGKPYKWGALVDEFGPIEVTS